MRKEDAMLDKEASRSVEGLEIGELDESRVGEAVDVVARGMRDNPLHLAAYGEDPERRLRKIHRFVSAGFAVKTSPRTPWWLAEQMVPSWAFAACCHPETANRPSGRRYV
jgi:hypothetical protein